MEVKQYINEVWKPIRGWENLYEVSNMGRVRSVDRWVNHAYGKALKKGKIVKPWLNNKGYYKIGLCKGSVVKKVYVHRLIAEAFIPNPDNLPEVNHKDCNPKNNCVENLEWCTRDYNCHYADAQAKQSAAKKGNINNWNSTPVLMLTEHGIYLSDFPSMAEAERVTGIAASSICAYVNGKANYLPGGFMWKKKRVTV